MKNGGFLENFKKKIFLGGSGGGGGRGQGVGLGDQGGCERNLGCSG